MNSAAAPSPPPVTAWEHYALGRSRLAADDLANAERELAAAVRLAPADPWSNFYYGLCAYRTNRPADAVAAFSVCIGASPDVPASYYIRARAFAALGRTEQAIQDWDRTNQSDPTHAPALLNGGMARFEQGRPVDALADLDSALKVGASPAAVYYGLALIRRSINDPARALTEVGRALQFDPSHARAQQLRSALHEQTAAAHIPPR